MQLLRYNNNDTVTFWREPTRHRTTVVKQLQWLVNITESRRHPTPTNQ